MRANQVREESQLFGTTSVSDLDISERVTKQPNSKSHQIAEMFCELNDSPKTFNPGLKVLKEQIVESKNAEINLNAFFEGSNACQLFIGENSEIVAFNEVCASYIEKVYGLKLYAGASVTAYSNEPYVAEFINNYYKALNGTPVQIKQQIKWNDEIIWCHFTYVPARNSQDKIIGVFFNLINTTKRIELKQKVFQQKKALTRIAFIQSHEVRRPVASILGLMNVFKASDYVVSKEELLMMEQAVNELDEKIREIVNHIH